jgi:hypothetical protein
MAQVQNTESISLAKPESRSPSRFSVIGDAVCRTPSALAAETGTFAIDALATFALFFARGGQLSPARIFNRKFSDWLRRFIAGKVGERGIRPGRGASTQHIVAVLAAKAQTNGGALTVDEFKSSMQAVYESLLPDFPRVSAEAGIIWGLFDVQCVGRIPADAFQQVLDVWSALGVSCDDDIRDELLRTASEEHADFIPDYLYYAWCQEVRVDMFKGLLRRRAKSSAREQRPPATFALGHTSRPGDQMQRSKEVASMQLRAPYSGDRLLDLSESVWQPTPAKTPRRKVPGAVARLPTAVLVPPSGTHSTSLPPVRPLTAPTIDPLEQEASWQRRELRLRPNMKVVVSYSGPDGDTRNATGTLLNGWGRPLTAVPNTSGDDGYLAVEVFGVERRVPRDTVTRSPRGATGSSNYL